MKGRISLRSMMCPVGWPDNARKPIPLACAECESFCAGGFKCLKTISADDFRALLCGGECETCRQPCNLRRIAAARGIRPEAVKAEEAKPKPAAVAKKRKKNKKITVSDKWIEIACRPYFERMRENERYTTNI